MSARGTNKHLLLTLQSYCTDIGEYCPSWDIAINNSLSYDMSYIYSGNVTIIISDLKHRLIALVGTSYALRFLRVSKINISTET